MMALTDDQQALYDEVVRRANEEARGDYAATLAAYARVGNDPRDIEAVRFALYGAHRPTSGDAVASFIIGVVSVFVCPLPFLGAAAVYYGFRSFRLTRPGIKTGQGFALAGQFLGLLNAIGWTIALTSWLVQV